MQIVVKFINGKMISQKLPINCTHSTVLKMDKGCGLSVKVTGGADAPFSIIFSNFAPGDAPVRIDNLCELVHIRINQVNSSQVINFIIYLLNFNYI